MLALLAAAWLFSNFVSCATAERSAYERAVHGNALGAFQDYLRQYSGGPHAADIQQRVADIYWQMAGAENTEQSYQQFIARCPQDQRVSEARTRKLALRFKKTLLEFSPAAYDPWLTGDVPAEYRRRAANNKKALEFFARPRAFPAPPEIRESLLASDFAGKFAAWEAAHRARQETGIRRIGLTVSLPGDLLGRELTRDRFFEAAREFYARFAITAEPIEAGTRTEQLDATLKFSLRETAQTTALSSGPLVRRPAAASSSSPAGGGAAADAQVQELAKMMGLQLPAGGSAPLLSGEPSGGSSGGGTGNALLLRWDCRMRLEDRASEVLWDDTVAVETMISGAGGDQASADVADLFWTRFYVPVLPWRTSRAVFSRISGFQQTTGAALLRNGNVALIGDRDSGLALYDLHQPATPTLISRFKLAGTHELNQRLLVVEPYGVIYDDNGVKILNFSDLANPVVAAAYGGKHFGTVAGAALLGQALYLATSQGLFRAAPPAWDLSQVSEQPFQAILGGEGRIFLISGGRLMVIAPRADDQPLMYSVPGILSDHGRYRNLLLPAVAGMVFVPVEKGLLLAGEYKGGYAMVAVFAEEIFGGVEAAAYTGGYWFGAGKRGLTVVDLRDWRHPRLVAQVPAPGHRLLSASGDVVLTGSGTEVQAVLIDPFVARAGPE